jgi:trafficking protein particle complex subunit 5
MATKSKHSVDIVDRPLTKNRLEVCHNFGVAFYASAVGRDLPLVQIPTVSLSAFAYLFSELIQYTLDRAASTTELEDR